jgi:hypothetical protein
MAKRFEGLFAQQEPIPPEGIERAHAVMASGRDVVARLEDDSGSPHAHSKNHGTR